MRSTTGRPTVRLGTKWLSMTSTCTRAAVEMRASSPVRSAKSALRMLGVMRTATTSRLPVAPEEGEEHRVGAVDVRPQLDGGPVTEAGDVAPDRLPDGLPRVEPGDVVAAAEDVVDDGGGLGQVRGAGDVGDHSPGPDGLQRRAQEVALEGGEAGQVGRLAEIGRAHV